MDAAQTLRGPGSQGRRGHGRNVGGRGAANAARAPLGGVGSLLPTGRAGAAPAPSPSPSPHGLRRANTLIPAALPLFDVSVAVLQSIDDLSARVGNAPLESALHLQAGRVYACQLEAYGSPFAAPSLQAVEGGGKLTDPKDIEFASCLAQPPEREEVSFSVRDRLVRLLSVTRAQQQQAQQLQQQGQQQMQQLQQQQQQQQQAPSLASGQLRRADSGGVAIGRNNSAAERRRGGVGRSASGNGDDAGGGEAACDGAGDGLAALPASFSSHASAPSAQKQQDAAAALLAGCHDVAAALVGVGALLVRGFEESSPSRSAGGAGAMEARLRRLLSVRSVTAPL